MGWYLVLLVVLAVFIVPFVVGSWLARRVRLPDHGWKIGLVLFVLAASVLVNYTRWPPKLGVDLSGGVILVYEVDQAKKDPTKPVDMGRLIEAVSRRVNPGGQKEMVIREYGKEQIEIILPKASEEEVREIKRIVSLAGTLEFRILANTTENGRVVELAMETPGSVVRDRAAKPDDPPLGWWVPVEAGRAQEFTQGRAVTRTVRRRGADQLQVLVLYDPYKVTGEYLNHAAQGVDQKGHYCVEFGFNQKGGQLFSQLTFENINRPLGIILNGYLYSAPNIMTTISDRGQITGTFTQEEVQAQVRVLLAGSLPAPLAEEPLSEMFAGPTLGADTIARSSYAMILSAILVPVFMLWYYRFSGVVANIALILNMLALVAIMIALKAPFTLTGLAGLALTVGMAVDNNVLVYERLREELERGAALRMAIRNAFQRASATIIDANLTTLIAATVLWVIGSDQVKGFAVTLWLGVALSMFTSVFVARVIFDIAEKRQWITKLKMLRVIGVTKIDFMRLFPITATMSIVITLGGLAIAAARGKTLFDIDFTGGVSVQVVFKEPQDIGQVRNKVEGCKNLEPTTVTDVVVGDEPRYKRFAIDTANVKLGEVEETLAKLFEGQLQVNQVEVGPLSRIEPQAVAPKTTEVMAEKPEPAGSPSTPAALQRAPGAQEPDVSALKKAKEAKAAEKPAAEKPAPEGKKDAKPAQDKPAADAKETPKAQEKPGDAKDRKQSRSDLPSDRLMAMAEASPLLLAQVAPEPKAADKPAADKPAADKKADPKDEKAPAKPESKPSDAKPGDAKPAETKPAETKPSDAKPVETKPLTTMPVEAAPAAPVDALAGGMQARLTFALPVSAKTVEEKVARALREMGLSPDTTAMDVSNPEAEPGQSKAYNAWDVKLKLPEDKAKAVLAEDKAKAVLAAVEKQMESEPDFPASNMIGGQVASNTQWKAFYALVLSWFFMILYLWVRFQRVAFGVAAVVALIHDVLVILGAIALSYYVAPVLGFLMVDPFKINLPIVAAFLTIIGYSVNDTIVIFDRIREIRGKDPHFTRKMVNDATNQTLSRTLLTSFTVMLVVIVLYIFGGNAVHGFAFALLIGVLTGTYSSVYVAAPILLWMIGTEKKDQQAAQS